MAETINYKTAKQSKNLRESEFIKTHPELLDALVVVRKSPYYALYDKINKRYIVVFILGNIHKVKTVIADTDQVSQDMLEAVIDIYGG